MRTSVIISAILILGISGCNRGHNNASGVLSSDTGRAVLVFTDYEHHFGKVAEGEKISYQFLFENKGTGPLVINSVSTTCGCTVPKYNTKPVKPGENGSIEVVFDTSGRNGLQTKTITVNSNASVPVILLKITAEVQNE